MTVICSRCSKKFDLIYAKRKIGRLYGKRVYDDYYPDEYVCGSCAVEEISADYGSGGEDKENMGSGWDYD